MFKLVGTLGIPNSVAGLVVGIISGASWTFLIISLVAGLLAGGIGAIATEGGMSAFINTVKNIIMSKGKAAAISW
ncbi:hypothetical protein OSSY52_08780 [Tepiditoga spiralis]|uniref:Uncharacterized protein n=1 Tax=Tepiditoga spiralis TaxID=2108365 RepID=A0A7G1G740_9BACT|nr:uberolysin/carnocyclin family circular bacteriocin [Tepiditoga spiralis]BBE30737.1 hypothetical protein OSSY52_08780 [Tepiditoga spiralis]